MARSEDPPVPTLGQLAQHVDWTWVTCKSCGRSKAVRFAPLIARYGADASSDVLRNNAVCTACGHKGASLTHPSWIDRYKGYAPFPGEE